MPSVDASCGASAAGAAGAGSGSAEGACSVAGASAGVGFSITIESAVADTRERPYAITDVKNEKGARKYVTTYQLTDKATGAVLAETSETKAKAKEIAKSLYTDKGFKGEIVCNYTKQVVEGETVAFTASYAPSKSSRVGSYLIFGIENA